MPYSNIDKRREYHKNYMAKWRKENPDKVKNSLEKNRANTNKKRRQQYRENLSCEHVRSSVQYQKHKDKRKKYREKRKVQKRDSNLQRQFGITIDDYNMMFQKQNGVCAICGKKETARNQGGLRPLSVDHCHKTNKVRGLLCAKCNTGLGQFQDNTVLLFRAIAYLANNGVMLCQL